MAEEARTGSESEERVLVDTPEKMNILGLLMKGLLSDNLADESKYKRVCSMKGDVLVKAGLMSVTLRFKDNKLIIIRGDTGQAKAAVEGSMGALLSVVTEGAVVWPFLSGKIGIGGNPFFLLKMLPLIQAE